MLLYFRKTACILGWIIGGLLLLSAITYGLLLFMNRHDSEPSAVFTAFMRASLDRPVPAETDNGYIVAMGFSSPPDADAAAEGRKRIDELNALMKKGKGALYGMNATNPVVSLLRGQPQTLRNLMAACGRPQESCAKNLYENHLLVSRFVEENPWILERYSSLIAKPQWREIDDHTSPVYLPFYPDVLDAQKIFLLQAWIYAFSDNIPAAERAIDRDHVFWRTVLANTDSLLTKMVAATALRRNYVLGSLALVVAPKASQRAGLPASWHREISAAERSLFMTYGGEIIFSSDLLKSTEKDGLLLGGSEEETHFMGRMADRLLRPLLKRQDTLNSYAAMLMENEDHFSAPLTKYPALFMARYKQAEDWHLSAYNPVGRLLIETGRGAYTDYYPRLSDLEGARRLALLTVTLHEQHTAPDAMTNAVAASSLRNPYDNKAFEWDGKAGFLRFHGLQPHTEKADFSFFYRP